MAITKEKAQVIDKPLNERQQNWINLWLTGPNKGNAYQCALEAGYSVSMAKQACIHLVDNCRIKAEIKRIRGIVSEKTDISIAKQVKETCELRQLAKEKGHISAALTANDQINRHIDFYEPDNASKGDKTLNVVIFGQPQTKPVQAITGDSKPILEGNSVQGQE